MTIKYHPFKKVKSILNYFLMKVNQMIFNKKVVLITNKVSKLRMLNK